MSETNALRANLCEECQRRMLREGPLDEGNFVAKVFDDFWDKYIPGISLPATN